MDLTIELKLSYICKRCKYVSNLVTDMINGEVFCPHCGIVIVDKILDTGDYGKTGYISDNESLSQEFISYTDADLGLSSVMNQSGKDVHGKYLSANSRESFRRLSIWDKKSKSRINRGMHMHLTTLQGIISRLGLPHTVEEEAAYQFRKYVSLGIHRRIGKRKLIPVVVYITCRRLNIPRTINDVAIASDITNRSLRRHYRKVILDLGVNPESIRSAKLIPRIATSLNLKEKVSRFAVELASKYENTRFSFGKHPSGIAASSLYLSCLSFGIDISQSHISIVSGISAVTIRNVSKSIRHALPELGIARKIANKKIILKE